MKRIALFFGICLVGFVSADVTCNEGDDFLPFPNDCTRYVVCVDGNAYEQKCPDGYWFNPANKYCDYPSNVDEKYCPVIECTPGVVYNLPTKHSCNEYILCFDGTPVNMKCADGLEFDPEVKECVLYQDSTCEILNCPEENGDEPVFLPNKRDCQGYYICVSGTPVPQKCADGLHWNANDKQCQPPKVAGCEASRLEIQQAALFPVPKPTTFSVACPPFGIKFLGSPTECEYYFGCNNGKSHLFQCPNGTAYDGSKRRCILRTLVEKCLYKL